MKTIVKQTREVGTSAGVLLPRSWLNKQVVVTLLQQSREEIAKDIVEIIFKYNLNSEIKGIYLFGSYARNDYEPDSDIDVLIITEKTNRLINYNKYELLFVSEDNFSKRLPSSLNFQSILSEAEVIFNSELIEKYRKNKPKYQYRKYLPEIKRINSINKGTIKLCEENNKNIPDGVVYSIVLRLRELYLIKCIINNRNYNKSDFLKIIGDKAYQAYLRIKRNESELNNLKSEDIKDLLDLSERWLKEIKD